MAHIASFARDRHGATTIVVALMLTALLGLASVGLNLAAAYLLSRRLQGVADLAALAAAQDLGHAQAAADATVRANRFNSEVEAEVVPGAYAATRDIAAGARFSADAAAPNAVRVRLSTRVPLIFGRLLIGRDELEVARTATAARADLASFSLGSRLASVKGGLANRLLSALAGGQVELSAADYRSLLDCRIDLFDWLDRLRTEVDLRGASYERVLASDVAAPVALGALAEAAEAQGDPAAAGALRALSAAADPALPARLDRLVDLGDYAAQDHVAGATSARIRAGALDLARAVLVAANGGRQVSADLSGEAPGLAGARLTLGIGELPAGSAWLTVDGSGERTIRTAQARLYLETEVAPTLPALKSLGVSVRAPLLVEAASASARLHAADCASAPGTRSASVLVRPSLGHVAVAEADPSRLARFDTPLAERPARLVQLPLVSADGGARVDLGGAGWRQLRFSEDEIDRRAVKSANARDITSASAASLLSSLQVTVQTAGVGVGLGGFDGAVKSTLQGAAGPLDRLLDGVSGVLGLRLGEADVTVNGLRCGQAALVG
jgi:uncharacterized membrane protein